MTARTLKTSSTDSQAASEETFSTYDLGCSAALVCVGNELKGLDRQDSRKASFVFYRTSDIDKQANAYWQDTLMVPARAYFDTIKMLKNRLYSE